MKVLSFALLLLGAVATATAQPNPVQWSFSTKKISDTEYELVFTAKIDKTWNIYSQFLESEDGPIPTSFTFDKNEAIDFIGKASEEGHKKEGFDKVFGMKVVKFTDEAVFTQKIRLKSPVKSVAGYLTFMTCDDQMCLPPKDVNFNIAL